MPCSLFVFSVDKQITLCLGHSKRCLKPYVFIYSVVTLTFLLISQCSVSCGEGAVRRLVTCRIGDQCTGEKPESHRPCRPGPCHGKMTWTHHCTSWNTKQRIGFVQKAAQGQKSALIRRFYGVLNGWTVHVVHLTKASCWKRMENIAQCTNSSALMTLFVVLLTTVNFPECFCGLWTSHLLSREACLARLSCLLRAFI